ncbi:MAG: hypothetical protein KIG55_01915 [Myroides sp.]|nr:hypothetical protein [Myroides sp.]
MRKLKYILASGVLAAGVASCETEPIDEKVKDDTLFVKPILRFELDNKQTVVTEKVTSSISPNNSITISARFSVFDSNDLNEETRYKPATLNITFNTLYTGNFPTVYSLDTPVLLYSSATLSINNVGFYSTNYAKVNQPAGAGNIIEMNEVGKYIDGNFDYILYPQEGNNLQPIRLSVGEFHYIKY